MTPFFCVNVILPALKAHAILAKKQTDETITLMQDDFAEKALAAMPAIQSNRILETASLKWFTPPGRKRND